MEHSGQALRPPMMFRLDAAGQSQSVDLIFTVTYAFNEQVPMYAFLTPDYVRNDAFAVNFLKAVNIMTATYHLPPGIN